MATVVGLCVVLAATSGCSEPGPSLTEEEAIQLVTAYLNAKTYQTSTHREVVGTYGLEWINDVRTGSCSRVARKLEGKFETTYLPEQKAWRVTGPNAIVFLPGPQDKFNVGREGRYFYDWLVYERTLVVESKSKWAGLVDCY